MADSKFNIQLTATFNEEQIKKSLKTLDKKVSLVVAVKFNKKQVQDALNTALGGKGTVAKPRTAKVEETEPVKTDIAADRLVSTTKQLNDQKELVKEIKSGYDSVGNSIREVYDAQGNLISATKKEGELAYKNDQTYSKLKDSLLDLSNRKIINSEDFERFNTELDEANKNTDELGKKQAFDKISMSIKNATKSGQGFFSSIKSLIPKLTQLNLAWMVVKAGMAILKKAVEAVITSVKELDKSFTEIQMVTKQTAQETAELRDSYIDLARSMGATVKEVTDGANDWLRAGMSIEETNEALEASMVLSKVGMVDSAEATKILVSAMRGYGLEANELMSIVDKLSAVDVAASVSTEDLGLAIQKGSASARLAGLSLDEYLGMVAAVAETTQESGDVIGNSFKRIFARAQQVKLGETVDAEGEDISNYFSDVDEAMSTIGINWASATDNLSDLGAGLDMLAEKWKGLEPVQKKQIAQAVAGSHQMDRFITLMDNYDRAVELTGVSMDSAGSAQEKYNIYLESLEARLNSAKATWQEVGAAFLDSGIVDILVDLIVVFSDFLALLIKATVKWGEMTGGFKALKTLIVILNVVIKLINYILELISWVAEEISKLGKKLLEWLGLDKVFEELKKSYNEFIRGDLSAELDALVNEIENGTDATKENKKATDEVTESYDKYAGAVNEAKKAISGLVKELDARLTAIDKEKERLDEERQIQDKLLSIEKAREELARAKQGRVLGFRIGKGFVEIEDVEAIQEAQENLNSAIQDYDDTILDINLEKVKQMQEILKAPTENLDSWRDYLDSFSTLLGTEFEGIYNQFVEFMTQLENATKDKTEWDATSDYDKVAKVVSGKNLRFDDYSRWGEVFKSEGVLDAWRNLSDWERLKLKMGSSGSPNVGWEDFVAKVEGYIGKGSSEKLNLIKELTAENSPYANILSELGVSGLTTIESLLGGKITDWLLEVEKKRIQSDPEKHKDFSEFSELIKFAKDKGIDLNQEYNEWALAVANAAERDDPDLAYLWRIKDIFKKEALYKHLQRVGYATGTTSASGGLSMVGENGPELRVLNRGDGIIPSSITKNLWEMGTNPYKFTDKSGGNNITFTGNLSFPNVTDERDAQAFIDKVMQISVPRMR